MKYTIERFDGNVWTPIGLVIETLDQKLAMRTVQALTDTFGRVHRAVPHVANNRG